MATLCHRVMTVINLPFGARRARRAVNFLLTQPLDPKMGTIGDVNTNYLHFPISDLIRVLKRLSFFIELDQRPQHYYLHSVI